MQSDSAPLARDVVSPPSRSHPSLVLIVEDDRSVARVLEQVVSSCGLQHRWVSDANRAAKIMKAEPVALILLDLRLDGKSGPDFLRELRAAGSTVPVFVVTGVTAPDVKIAVLREGADDYVTKPFLISEVELRIRALLRRSHQRAVLTVFDSRLVLHHVARTVQWCGEPIALTATEFSILWILAKRAGVVVDTGEICNDVFGGVSDSRIADCRMHVSNLRSKISAVTDEVQVLTRRPVGYRLVLKGDS